MTDDSGQERWTDEFAGATETEHREAIRYAKEDADGDLLWWVQEAEALLDEVVHLRDRLRGSEGERCQEGSAGDESRNREPDIDTLHDEAKRDVSRLMRVVEGLETVRVTCHNGHTSTLRELRDEADCSAPCCPRSGCDECSFTFEPSDALSPTDGEEGGVDAGLLRNLQSLMVEAVESPVEIHKDWQERFARAVHREADPRPEEAGGEGGPEVVVEGESYGKYIRQDRYDSDLLLGVDDYNAQSLTWLLEQARGTPLDTGDWCGVLLRLLNEAGYEAEVDDKITVWTSRLRRPPEGAGESEYPLDFRLKMMAASGRLSDSQKQLLRDASRAIERLRTGREGLPEDVLTWAWSEAIRAFYASHTTTSGPEGRSHHYDEDALRRWRAISETLGGWHERDFWRRIDLAEGLEREDVSGTGRKERDDASA